MAEGADEMAGFVSFVPPIADWRFRTRTEHH